MTWQQLFHNPIDYAARRLRQRQSAQTLRESYLPTFLKDVPPFTPSDTDLSIWVWEAQDRILGVAFQGRAQKPLWYNSFRSKSDRSRKIQATIDSRKAALGAKEQRAAVKRAFRHSLKIGDVLYASWGYEQTNVDFYQVVGLRGESSVVIQGIGKKVAKSHEALGTDYVVPAYGTHGGKLFTKRVSEGNCVSMSSYKHACLWDGKPKYETSLGWGH